MPESPLRSREVILIDKSRILKDSTQITSSSRTSEVGSISKGKVLRRFWNAQTQGLSRSLWLPIKTDSLDSASNCSVGSSKEKEGDSWFSIERSLPQKKSSSKISSQSSPSSQPESMGSEAMVERSREIQLFPTPDQNRILREWMGIYRWYYNRTLEVVQSIEKFSFFKIRKIMREKYSYDRGVFPEWYSGQDVPSRIIDGAIKTCCTNYKVNFELLRKHKISHFKVSFKTKKEKQSIYLNGDLFSKRKNGFCLKYLGERIRSSEPIKGISRASRLIYYPKLEKFYLHTPWQKRGRLKSPFNLE